jgi:3'-5' exonuclease
VRSQLITFNGHRFDLPVLRYRAMVHRASAAGLQVRPYFHRFSEDALDLCDALGSFSPGARVKLDEISKILSLTGKPEGALAVFIAALHDVALANDINGRYQSGVQYV